MWSGAFAANPDLEPTITKLSAKDQATLAAFDGHRIAHFKELMAKVKPLVAKLGPAILDNAPALISALKEIGVVIAPGEQGIIDLVIAALKVVPKST